METKVKLFLNGELSFEQFIEALDQEIIMYLDEKYQIAYKRGVISEITYNHSPTFEQLLKKHLDYGLSFSSKSSIYDFIYQIFYTENTSLKYFEKYKNESLLSIKAIPDYLDGGEATLFIEKEIFLKIPTDISETQKIKFIKDECKRLFHIEGKKIPYWVRGAEWPIRNGKPCKYMARKRNGDLVQFIFEDVVTNELVIVEQYY